jgi:hypothetical protein
MAILRYYAGESEIGDPGGFVCLANDEQQYPV